MVNPGLVKPPARNTPFYNALLQGKCDIPQRKGQPSANGLGIALLKGPQPEKPFPACLEERRLLIPGRRSMLGRKLLNWFNSQGLNVEILGEFDDAALMKAFGAMHNAIFVAPTLYAYDFYADKTVVEIGRVENVMEEYHAIFAERMIQHPAVQRICNTDYSALFSPAAR